MKTETKKRTHVLSARVSDKIASKVIEIASSNELTVSDYIESLINRDLRKKRKKEIN